MADLTGMWGDKTQEEMAAEAKGSFEIVPPGWHNCTIAKTEMSKSKAGDDMLIVDFEVNGNTIKHYMMLTFKADLGKQSGFRAKLAKLACCCGIDLKQSEQLHGLPLDVKVIVDEFESNVEAGKMLKSNKINDFAKLNTKSKTVGPSTPPAATGNAPW